jgi:hypothetical protein
MGSGIYSHSLGARYSHCHVVIIASRSF